jgi:hypothetical protein
MLLTQTLRDTAPLRASLDAMLTYIGTFAAAPGRQRGRSVARGRAMAAGTLKVSGGDGPTRAYHEDLRSSERDVGMEAEPAVSNGP